LTGSDGRKENRKDASSVEMITYVDNASQLMETLIWDVAQDI
jgi:hypothetical protein